MNPTASTRNAGLELLSRVNRWLIAGAIAVAGFLSLLAERAFRGHTASAASSAALSSTSASQQSSSSGSSLNPSQSTPSSAPAPAPVVSGGS